MTRPTVFADTSHPDALEASTAARKMLIVDATASWCQPCQVMDRVTWVDPNVVAWIAEHALAIQIDVDKEAAVAATLGIRSMPTVVVFRDGVELDRRLVTDHEPARARFPVFVMLSGTKTPSPRPSTTSFETGSTSPSRSGRETGSSRGLAVAVLEETRRLLPGDETERRILAAATAAGIALP